MSYGKTYLKTLNQRKTPLNDYKWWEGQKNPDKVIEVGGFSSFNGTEGVVREVCTCGGCYDNKIVVENGDVIKSSMPHGMLLKTSCGTMIRVKEFKVYRLPPKSDGTSVDFRV